MQELKENENKKININKLIKEIEPEFDNLKNLYVGVASKVNSEKDLENTLLNINKDYVFGYKLLEENKLICMIKTNNKKLDEIFEKNIISNVRKFYTVI